MTDAAPRPGHRHDLLVIGGGPAGSATAYWAAEHGLDVVFVERKRFPREKTCGDGLTPRAAKQLHDMGLADTLSGYHRIDGLRAIAHGKTLELKWPEHPVYPSFGYVVRRADLDTFVAENAVNRGAILRQHTEALAPIFTPRHANETRMLVCEVIDGLLDEWTPKSSFEFQEFASYFPISVLSRMIGGPVEAIPRLRSSMELASLFFAMDASRMPEIDAAYRVLDDFAQGLLTERRTRPVHDGEADLLDMLIAASTAGKLSDREIVDLLMFMYTAGYDTSKNVLTLIMRQMIERPDLYERCAADVEFCRKVVEEMLRFCGVSTSFRITTTDVEYRDVLLPKGAMIFFPVSVAGRDPGTFAQADRFDPERPNDPQHRHIAFGRGMHVCLGQHLARVQLQEGLHRIAQRIREPKLAGEIAWRPFPGVWGLKALPISFVPT